MAQLNLILGTPGDSNTGEFVFESMAKIESNFNDLYANKANLSALANYLPLAGGTMLGDIDLDTYNIFLQEMLFKNGPTSVMSVLSAGTTNGIFEILPPGSPQHGLNYTDPGIWSVGTNAIITEATFASQTLPASNVSFSSYLSITSATAQLAIQELKDELDGVVASSGSGDMLKATYDTTNNGIVDNSEKLNNQAASFYQARANHTGTQLAATISDFQSTVSANSNVTANTAKVGITPTQANDITTNNAKVGITTQQANDIITNNAKVGITTQQANDITANNAKVGITPTQASNITTNNAKVGITTQQANDIVNNNAKITNATHTGEVTGSEALTITNDAVTNAKLANMLPYTIKGRFTNFPGDPEDITSGQLATIVKSTNEFVPYTGAVTNVDLNNKNLINVATFAANSVKATSFLQGSTMQVGGATSGFGSAGWILSSIGASFNNTDRLSISYESSPGSFTAGYTLRGGGTPTATTDLITKAYGDATYGGSLTESFGNWTPTVSGSTGGTAFSVTSNCDYVKIGKMVYISANLTSINMSSGSGVLEITGLPFTVGDGDHTMAVSQYRNLNTGNITDFVGQLQRVGSKIIFKYNTGINSQLDTTLQAGAISSGSLYFSGTYITYQ